LIENFKDDDSSSSNEVESNNKEVAPVINEKAYEYYERGKIYLIRYKIFSKLTI